jgi:hypothetical protein
MHGWVLVAPGLTAHAPGMLRTCVEQYAGASLCPGLAGITSVATYVLGWLAVGLVVWSESSRF